MTRPGYLPRADRERQIVDAVAVINDAGRIVTYNELAQHVGLTSLTQIRRLVDGLVEQGRLFRDPQTGGVRLLRRRWFVAGSIVQTIQCGDRWTLVPNPVPKVETMGVTIYDAPEGAFDELDGFARDFQREGYVLYWHRYQGGRYYAFSPIEPGKGITIMIAVAVQID